MLGVLVMVPFFSLPGLYTGPVAEAIGGADLSFAVGLVVAGGAYYLFSRGIDHDAERAARERSESASWRGPAPELIIVRRLPPSACRPATCR